MNKPIIRVPAVTVHDGFVNFASRIGTSADKSSYGHYALTFLDAWDVDAAYRTGWFRKIVDIPPGDEVREWRTWNGADAKQVEAIDNEEKRHDIRRKVRESRILARKDGGSILLMGLPGDPSQQAPAVTRGALQFVTVLSRYEVTPGDRDTDPLSPNYGAPGYYMLADGRATRVHPSRVVRFIGNPVRNRQWDGWGESVWLELRECVAKADQIAAGIAALVDEAKLDIVRIKGMMANMATAEYEALLLRRWAAVMTMKSSVNALMLDGDDEYDQKSLTFQGLTDIQNNALTIMAGRADIPATRLLGRSPAGMNATGESDLRNYYDRIRAGQQTDLQPTLKPLDDALVASAIGSVPAEVYYEWSPLYQMTEKEAAEVEKLFADTAEKYANMGVIPDTALTGIVRDGIIERGQWPGAQSAYDDAEKAGELPEMLEEPTEAEQAAEQAMLAMRTGLPAPAAGGPTERQRLAANDAAPRTLYVSRAVLNSADIKAWARKQGFATTVDDMHVTIAMSHDLVDWMKIPDAWSFGDKNGHMSISAGGARIVDRLGEKAIVLLFNSSELSWRHTAIREAGASWDFPDYQPHVTLTYDAGDVDIARIDPYRGTIELGPEIFETVNEDPPHGESA